MPWQDSSEDDLDEQEVRQTGSAIYLLFEGALVETQNFQDPWPIIAARKQVKSLLLC